MLTKSNSLFLAILSGLLLFAAWPVSPFTFLIFIAFIPLFQLEQQSKSKLRFFWFVCIAMFIWNAGTTWWIWNSTILGALMAIVANSLLMTLPWLFFYSTKRKFGNRIGYFSFILFWLCFEYLHLQDWGLSWPWLTLGNVFASHPGLIQWYEITGTSGGSLWVLTVNVLIYNWMLQRKTEQKKGAIRLNIVAALLLLLPMGISFLMGLHTKKPGDYKNIVIVQPDIDPYEKIEAGTFQSQLQRLISLSESQIDSNTALIVWPETALYEYNGLREDQLKETPSLAPLWQFLQRHPGIALFTGIESYRIFNAANKTIYSQKFISSDLYYDSYNGAVLAMNGQPFEFYHKSKLVPGVETLPWFLRFLSPVFEKFGGTAGGYAKQDNLTEIKISANGYNIAPAICYESIYGEYLTQFIRSGANIICIITNDGWWGNTPGYKQHMDYARMRAVENRKWVVRSANTGISCFIDPYGKVYDAQPWDKEAAIKMPVPAINGLTFYSKNGDLISRLVLILTTLLVLWMTWSSFKVKKKNG